MARTRKSKPSVKASLAGSVLSGAEKAKKSGTRLASKAAKVLDVEAKGLEVKAKKGGAKLASKAAKGLEAGAKGLEGSAKKSASASRTTARKAAPKAKTAVKMRAVKK